MLLRPVERETRGGGCGGEQISSSALGGAAPPSAASPAWFVMFGPSVPGATTKSGCGTHGTCRRPVKSSQRSRA